MIKTNKNLPKAPKPEELVQISVDCAQFKQESSPHILSLGILQKKININKRSQNITYFALHIVWTWTIYKHALLVNWKQLSWKAWWNYIGRIVHRNILSIQQTFCIWRYSANGSKYFKIIKLNLSTYVILGLNNTDLNKLTLHFE